MTMNPYLLAYKVKPRADNTEAADIHEGWCRIWVFSSSMDQAKASALRYIERYKWIVTEDLGATLSTPEHLAGLDTHTVMLYRKAELSGIAAYFEGWPKGERPGGFELRVLTDFDDHS